MKNDQLDKYCIEIILVLAQRGYSSSFNKLYEAISESGFDITVPTLSRHLKHLISEGYVSVEKKGKQMKIYRVNPNKTKKIKEVWDRAKGIAMSMRKNREEFLSKSEEEQIALVLHVLGVRKLEEIKAQIAYKLDPKSLEKRFELVFLTSPYLTAIEGWVIKKSVEDEKYRKQILKVIDELLKPKTKQRSRKGE